MIRAIVFDLDGTLVQTEKMKAQAYAMAVHKLRHLPQPDLKAVEAYREIVGTARDVASRHVMEKLGLEKELRPLMSQYHVSEPWEVLTAVRTTIYSKMIADPEVIQQNQWPHTLELLRMAKDYSCRTALATMSHLKDTENILHVLNIYQLFDVIVTVEDVKHSKPDPEIYLLAAQKLKLPPDECLVIEDSPSGVESATAAGTHVVAFATPFTFCGLHSRKMGRLINHALIVHRPEKLVAVVLGYIKEEAQLALR